MLTATKKAGDAIIPKPCQGRIPGHRACGLLLPRNEKKKILDDRHERFTEEKFRGKTNDAESGDQQDQEKYDSAEF